MSLVHTRSRSPDRMCRYPRGTTGKTGLWRTVPWVSECIRPGCSRPAVATLTYVYAERTAVLGPLGPSREPGAYDMCAEHAEALSAPVGWEVIRLPDIDDPAPAPPVDDLMALAAAVRGVGMLEDEVVPEPDPASVHVLGRRGHLSVITDASHDVRSH